jgi:hypothetical protein
MRDIKFRVWDDKLKIIFSPDNQIGGLWSIKESHNGIIKYKDGILMQFAELQDKNDKDIYEGDILKHNDNLYYIKFSKNQRVLLLRMIDSKTNWRSLEWCNNVKKYIEIIGNIHENPELLN